MRAKMCGALHSITNTRARTKRILKKSIWFMSQLEDDEGLNQAIFVDILK